MYPYLYVCTHASACIVIRLSVSYVLTCHDNLFFPLVCPLVGQMTTLCVSSCPQDCFRPGNESCVKGCDGCACPPPTIADYITGECVQPEQCTGKLILPASYN